MVTSCTFEEMTLFLQSRCKTNSLWTFLIISETHHVPPDFEIYVEWYLTIKSRQISISRNRFPVFILVDFLEYDPRYVEALLEFFFEDYANSIHICFTPCCNRSLQKIEIISNERKTNTGCKWRLTVKIRGVRLIINIFEPRCGAGLVTTNIQRFVNWLDRRNYVCRPLWKEGGDIWITGTVIQRYMIAGTTPKST